MAEIKSTPIYQVVRTFVPHSVFDTKHTSTVGAVGKYMQAYPQYEPVTPIIDNVEFNEEGFSLLVQVPVKRSEEVAWLASVVNSPDAPKSWTHVTCEGQYVKYSFSEQYGHQYFLYKTSYSGWDTQFASSLPDLRSRKDLEQLLGLLAPMSGAADE